MTDRFPGYDVLSKRDTPSWDEITRRVVDERLATPQRPRFLTPEAFETAEALCRRIVPQPNSRPEVPLAALLDAKLLANHGDGFREAGMPYMRDAWRDGLAALDAEARGYGADRFVALDPEVQDHVLRGVQQGDVREADAWCGMDPALFFAKRVLADIPTLYYSHPVAWNEIGFGGPASPRGYVRLGGDRRDPWEAAEAYPGREDEALAENRHVV